MDRRTAIYARTSTARQSTGHEAQRRALDDHLCLRGIEEHFVFEDSGISGTRSSRPGLDSLMTAVRTGTVKEVIVYSFSRFARSTRHLLAALEELR